MKYYKISSFDNEQDLQRFVAECEEQLEARMDAAISTLRDVKDLRFCGLTGPTCSGKTTAARKMTEMLEAHGLCVRVISLDDFYYDKEYLHRRAENDPNIEIDYDSEETIDIDLLSDVAARLFAGERTPMPHFNFKSGMREEGELIEPRENDVFLFEGIQTLYPRVSEILNRHHSYRSISIFPQSSIEVGGKRFLPNEIRLYRRLVRDHLHRATDSEFTLYLWKSVRENENRNIFPNLDVCHASIDSTMPYEIGMLKPYLEPLMRKIAPQSAFYEKAQEILENLRDVQPVSADYIFERSLYKEFI
ncbi:MAG: hypothetical protein IJW29_07135 [Clostridia bacterium]|nr:hypothetical protein [Clostridia bacterium]